MCNIYIYLIFSSDLLPVFFLLGDSHYIYYFFLHLEKWLHPVVGVMLTFLCPFYFEGYCFSLSMLILIQVLLLSQYSSIIPKLFSSCSLQDFEKYMLNDMPKCLTNIPDINTIVAPPTCGNGFVEKGEECDCGTAEVSA